MNRHYEKSRPLSETLLSAGGYLLGGLAVVFLLLAVFLVVGQILRPGQNAPFFLAISALPLLVLSAICFAAYRSARRGSRAFYGIVVGAVLFVVLVVAALATFFEGFTPG